MKRFLLLSAALFAAAVAVSAPRVYTLANDRLTLRVEVDDAIRYAVDAPAGPILLPSRLAMTLGDGRTLGEAPRVRRSVRRTVGETIEAPLYRQRLFETHYELLELEFAGDYAVEFRLYPDGVAYRFRTASKEPFRVERETAEWCFAADFAAEVTYVRPGGSDPYRSSFENQYLSEPLSACRGRETLIFAPLYVDCGAAGRVLVTESDVESYPGMFLRAGGQPHSVEAEHPGYPTDYVTDGSNARYPSAYAGHIARVEGTRTFPWRLLVYGRTDAELADNNMVYQTASPSRVADTSWIRGGHAAWDWWNGITVAGVDFRSGVNTETYLHYVDFAARYGLEYVLIDDGWYSYEHHDLLRPRDEVDLAKIVAYGRSRGVDILLWAVGNTFCEQLEAVCAHYAAMGVKGFKVDFFDRQDQPLVESLYRMAETTARYGLTIDFHGIYKPTGLSRTYPNVVNYEGVFGLEQLKWTDRTEADMPRNDALLPFTRGAVGPLDYTPGAMLNATRANFRAVDQCPMSQGTRAHQVALYVIFDSPLVILCDTPTHYEREAETTRFIASIPTVVDRTRVLQGERGEWVVTARRKGDTWWIGGITSWTPRDVEVDLAPLLGGGRWRATLFRDGVNADRVAEDYAIETFATDCSEPLKVHCAPGGGFVVRLEKM